jgi:hypothetical protein
MYMEQTNGWTMTSTIGSIQTENGDQQEDNAPVGKIGTIEPIWDDDDDNTLSEEAAEQKAFVRGVLVKYTTGTKYNVDVEEIVDYIAGLYRE